MPPFAAPPSRGSREFTPPFAALPSRGSRDFLPPFAAQRSRRSREFTPPFADHPALSSRGMTPPSTANPSPPACLWLNARRPASDSMPAGLPLIPARQECRWLKLAGLPLTQARRIAADSCHWSSAGKANSPLSSSRRRLRLTDPAVRGRSRRRPWGKPTHRRRLPLVLRGKPTRRPAVHSARSRLRLPPARRPCRCVVKPAGCCHYLSSQPIMVSPDGRCRIDKPAGRGRIWPDSDHGLFNCLCVFSPGGLLIPLSFPKEIWGGVVGLRPKRLRWGLGPRSRKRSHHGLPSSLLRHGLPSSLLRHGLPSSLLHLDLGLSVPLWRPRPVYVSVSVLWGLQSAHPPSPVVLLRHGTCLPGGGSYVRDLSFVSCGLVYSLFPVCLPCPVYPWCCH